MHICSTDSNLFGYQRVTPASYYSTLFSPTEQTWLHLHRTFASWHPRRLEPIRVLLHCFYANTHLLLPPLACASRPVTVPLAPFLTHWSLHRCAALCGRMWRLERKEQTGCADEGILFLYFLLMPCCSWQFSGRVINSSRADKWAPANTCMYTNSLYGQAGFCCNFCPPNHWAIAHTLCWLIYPITAQPCPRAPQRSRL